MIIPAEFRGKITPMFDGARWVPYHTGIYYRRTPLSGSFFPAFWNGSEWMVVLPRRGKFMVQYPSGVQDLDWCGLDGERIVK